MSDSEINWEMKVEEENISDKMNIYHGMWRQQDDSMRGSILYRY
jgi:hypothetical protein